jgi:hypothetical protein
MTMKKRSGKCDEATFWAAVAECNWAERSKENRGYNSLKREILESWTNEFIRSFEAILSEKVVALGETIQEWESREGENVPCGDDGFSDLRHHVVGLGREVYEATTANPALAKERAERYDYVESFSYAIPHVNDESMTLDEMKETIRREREERRGYYDEDAPTEDELEAWAIHRLEGDRADMNPAYYAARARQHLPEIEALLNGPFADRVGREDLEMVRDALAKVGAGNVEAMAGVWGAVKDTVKRLRDSRERVLAEEKARLEALEPGHYGLDNLFSDGEQNF